MNPNALICPRKRIEPNSLVLTTVREDGAAVDRVLETLQSYGQLYVAVNHWPRAWHRRLLVIPRVQLTSDGGQRDYVAVPVADEEHARVDRDHPRPLAFLVVTGSPPRRILRLDQETYVNNPEAAISNQLDVWRVIDPDASVRPATFAGRPANRFAYKQVTGQRTAYIEQTWIRLTNRVRLHVISVSNLDDESRLIFERERNDILQTFVIDKDRLQELNEPTNS